MFKRKNTKPYGPWTADEVSLFASDATGAASDTRNLRYDYGAVGTELAGRQFDAAELWMSLEANRYAKWDRDAYNVTVVR